MSTETKTEQDNKTLIERLFSAGSHFGFTKSRRHPTVIPYLFGSKQGTDIFDLEKTSELLVATKELLAEAGKAGKTVLFVGTKDEISPIVKAAAEEAGAPYVTNRWIGGTLTNFSEIKKRFKRLLELNAQEESGELERKFTKKERVVLGREHDKLMFNFGGTHLLERLPDMLLVVDPRHDSIAVQEAKEAGIPVIGITSSDGNLRDITYPVLANDSLQSSVSLLLHELSSALLEGKSAYVEPPKKNEGRRKTA